MLVCFVHFLIVSTVFWRPNYTCKPNLKYIYVTLRLSHYVLDMHRIIQLCLSGIWDRLADWPLDIFKTFSHKTLLCAHHCHRQTPRRRHHSTYDDALVALCSGRFLAVQHHIKFRWPARRGSRYILFVVLRRGSDCADCHSTDYSPPAERPICVCVCVQQVALAPCAHARTVLQILRVPCHRGECQRHSHPSSEVASVSIRSTVEAQPPKTQQPQQ